MEQEKNMQVNIEDMQVNVEKSPDKKHLDLSELIRIDVRSIEIPASEYTRLVDAESKLESIVRAIRMSRYGSEIYTMLKIILRDEIEADIKAHPDTKPEEDE